MKQKFLFFVLAIVAGFSVFAQKAPVRKLYAYSQVVLPGTKRNIAVDETGKEINANTEKKVNYFFYAEQKESETIKVIAVWVLGKKYAAKADTVSNIPVEIPAGGASGGSKKIVLAPATGNKFLAVIPGVAVTAGPKTTRFLQKMTQGSELVLVYQWKGKTWYFPVKKIKFLEPLASV